MMVTTTGCCFCALWPLQPQSAPPGAYQVPGALGRQVASTKESAPGIKIGTSLRALDYEVRKPLHGFNPATPAQTCRVAGISV
jgi:hypothetical protein